MPENPTLEEVIKRLGDLIKVADITKSPCIASLWVNEAKLIYKCLLEAAESGS